MITNVLPPFLWFTVYVTLLVAFLPLVLVIILVDLGNKLGIGQDKDASRSSMPFVEFNLSNLINFTCVMAAHEILLYFCVFIFCLYAIAHYMSLFIVIL